MVESTEEGLKKLADLQTYVIEKKMGQRTTWKRKKSGGLVFRIEVLSLIESQW